LPASDINLLESCLADHVSPRIVTEDAALGAELQVRATPTIFINGRRVPPVRDQEALHSAIATALQEAQAEVRR
jgi:protein-disulfide isomerase